ncbi:MAG: DUF6172 family protein [Akkermansiaceae bacterium]|nr:DUF6172 family protein [Akkermansiaceae bacterium]
MKKVFSLVSERHKPARLVEQIKSEVKKYLKRERNKSLPEDHDYWGFNCRSGQASDSANVCHEKEIGKSIDHALAEGWETVYLEILVEPRKRGSK